MISSWSKHLLCYPMLFLWLFYFLFCFYIAVPILSLSLSLFISCFSISLSLSSYVCVCEHTKFSLIIIGGAIKNKDVQTYHIKAQYLQNLHNSSSMSRSHSSLQIYLIPLLTFPSLFLPTSPHPSYISLFSFDFFCDSFVLPRATCKHGYETTHWNIRYEEKYSHILSLSLWKCDVDHMRAWGIILSTTSN